MPIDGPYDRPIQDLERQSRDLEGQARDLGRMLAKLNSALVTLRELAATDKRASLPVGPVEQMLVSVRPPVALESDDSAYASGSYQKGDIIKLVIAALEQQPGMRSSQLGDLLKDKVTSGAKNPRKLIINAVSYLAATHRVRKTDKGGWELIRTETTNPSGR
jgi:hypothetical protein